MREGSVRTKRVQRGEVEGISGKRPVKRIRVHCGACGTEISRFARIRPSCGTRALLSDDEGGDAR